MPKFKNGTNQKALSNVTKPINHCSFTFSYRYDANGNQYADFNKGIAWIQFNSLNLPRKIQFGNGNKAEYFYDATGVKYGVKWTYAATPQNIPLGATGTEYPSPTGGMRTEYCGNYVYENGILRKIITPEGYVVTNGNVSETVIKMNWYYRYILKDHLGNTRRALHSKILYQNSITLTPGSHPIDYYPFGLEITRVTNPEGGDYSSPYLAGATIPYLYNGKEIDRMHGLNWYDYGARFYDGAIGRWHGVDPLAEKYPNISSYVYVANNPVRFVDPDGREIYSFEVSFKGTVGFIGVSLGKALGLKYSAGAAENEWSFHMKYDSNLSNLTIGEKHVIREHKEGGYQVSGAYGKAQSEQREIGTEGSVSVNLKSGKVKTTDVNVNDRSFKAVEEGSVGIFTTTEKEGEPSKSSFGLAPEINFGLGVGAAVNLSVQESDQKNTGKTTQNTTYKSTTQHKK